MEGSTVFRNVDVIRLTQQAIRIFSDSHSVVL